MIVDCAVYQSGKREDGGLTVEEVSEALETCGEGFVWIGLKEPTEGEFDAIAREFDLHELAVEDAVEAHQRPKLEVYGETLFVVLKTARYVDSEEVVEFGEVQVFLHENFVITVRHGEGSELARVRSRAEQRPDLVKLGPGAVLHVIVDQIVDDYDIAANGLETDVQEVEDEVFSPQRTSPAERIYYLEREVLAFQKAVTPLQPAVDRLARGHFDLIPDEMHDYFRDVRDHLLRTSGRIHGFREMLGSALHANLTQVAVRQNEDMRKISAWVAILATPTMIAGVYGMNFEQMPELGWTLGYPLALLVMVVACSFLYIRFKSAGWL